MKVAIEVLDFQSLTCSLHPGNHVPGYEEGRVGGLLPIISGQRARIGVNSAQIPQSKAATEKL